MNCPKCGSANRPSDAFCGSCGNPVGFTRGDSTSADTTPPLSYTSAVAPPTPLTAVASPAATSQGAPPPPPAPQYSYGTTSPPPGAYATPGFLDPVSGVQLAEWWKRVLAYLLDSVIVWVPIGVIISVLNTTIGRETMLSSSGVLVHKIRTPVVWLDFVAWFVVTIAYYAILNGGTRGQTVGKMALRIAVRDQDGRSPIGVGRAALRIFITLVLVFAAVLDDLWPLWDPRRQSWHDKVARSLVVAVT